MSQQNPEIKMIQKGFRELVTRDDLLKDEHNRIIRTLEDYLSPCLISIHPEKYRNTDTTVGISSTELHGADAPFKLPEFCSYHNLQRKEIGSIGGIGLYSFPLQGLCSIHFDLPSAGIRKIGSIPLKWLYFEDILPEFNEKFSKGSSKGLDFHPENLNEEILKRLMEYHFKKQIRELNPSDVEKAMKTNQTDFNGLIEMCFSSYETDILPYDDAIREVASVFETVYHPKNLLDFKIQ